MELITGTQWGKPVPGSWGEIESKEKGTMGFRIVFELDGDATGKHKGERHAWEAWFSDKTMERMYDSLSYCGWDGKSIKEAKLDPTISVPLEFEIEESLPVDKKDEKGVVIGKEPGKKYSRIRWVNNPAGRASIHKVPDAASQDAFEQRMQGSLAAWREKRNKAAPAGDGTNFDFGANAPPVPADGAPPPEPPKPVTEEAKQPNPATGF